MQLQRYGIGLLTLSALLLSATTSCTSDDDPADVHVSTRRQISFDPAYLPASRGMAEATVTDTFSLVATEAPVLYCTELTESMEAPLSRATVIESPDAITDMGVIANASWYGPLLMNNDHYQRDASGNFVSPDVRYWVDDATSSVTFYAFSPYNAAGLTLPTEKTSTSLSYTVPATADEQQDLTLAVNTVAGNYNAAVPLKFNHLLTNTKVHFADIPQGWQVRSVSFSNLNTAGTLDFAATTPSWTYTDAATSTVSAQTSGTNVDFMLLPQTSPVTLTVVVSDGTNDISYSHELSTDNWRAGRRNTYSISMWNYQFSLTTSTDADAHYVIYKTSINADNVPAGKKWTVTCNTPGVDATIQRQSDINTFAADGFWTDRYYDGSTTNRGASARGDKSLTLNGSGTFDVAVFVPENTGTEPRDIVLSIQVEDKSTPEDDLTFRQLNPAWVGGNGWEQIDDNDSDFYGFKWNRLAYYVYVYNNGFGDHSSSNNEAYCQQIIDENNAGSYAKTERRWTGRGYRWCIRIDYSSLSTLVGIATSSDNGLSNTINLNHRAGSASTGSFETVLANIKKTESGHETEAAFRLGNGSDNIPAPTGDNITGAPAIGHCLKKNRYNLLQTRAVDGELAITPFINDDDIVWYLPAVDEFSTLPSDVVSPIVPSECWSSTAVGDASNAYFGNRSTADRLTTHKVRAIRKTL